MSSYKRIVPFHYAKARGVVDVGPAGEAVRVFTRASADATTLAEVRRLVARPLQVECLDSEAFDTELGRIFSHGDNHAANMIGDIEQEGDLERLAQELPEVEDLLEAEDDAPIIRLINALFTQALRENASDIHIEPFETRSVVRFRVDGRLRDIIEPRRALHAAILSRIKVMANLDISEKRLPQDGRITLRIAGRPVDVRVSTLPTGHGERAVLRLLDKAQGRLALTSLGMAEDTLAQLDELIHQPHGIILVTGPTGSGKSTTLYAALRQLDAQTINIMTVEDPIEYDLDGVGQTQVNAKIEMSFSRALRAILRQDPDVIMIGEIRDLETAQIAVQASLTGHLVLATLHTNDAASAITRLVDMGIEPFLLASSLLGVMGQRLVRNLCTHCRTPYEADAAERSLLKLAAGQLYRPAGCEQCNFSGYRGRAGLYELLIMDDDLRHLIHDNASEASIKSHAHGQQMRTMRDEGLRRVAAGLTTIEEVLRVTREN